MPVITKTWLGGGNNAASNPNDWTPAGAPLPGDDLVMTLGGTINIAGNDLAGDSLTVTGSARAGLLDTEINTKANAALNLIETSNDAAVSVHITGKLSLTAQVEQLFGNLSFIGGSINLVGTSSFQGATVTFDTDLMGNGTIDAGHGGNGYNSGQYEFAGSVGSGVTIALEGGGPPESMQIDHPSSFKGEIVLPGGGNSTLGSYGQPFYGNVLFEGLHVTTADLIPGSDVLQMWNGKHLVDTVRLGGDTSNLYVQQTTTGVTLGTTDLDMSNGMPIVGNLFH
jgi:hypothetical protein